MKLTNLFEEIEFELIQGDLNVEIEHLAYHSKRVKDQSLFISMNGAYQNGNLYIHEAIKNGAIAIVYEGYIDPIEDIIMIQVKDARRCLALLSCCFFKYPARQLTVVGITGTKGKTTTALMLYETLKNAKKSVGLIGTNGVCINEQIYDVENTTPESYEIQYYLKKMVDLNFQYVIIEVTSIGMMRHRVDGIVFDIGCFTNLSPDHIGENEHKSFDEYKYYKMELLRRSRMSFIHKDDFYVEEMIHSAMNNIRLYSVSRIVDQPVNHVQYIQKEGMKMSFLYQQHLFTIPMPGRFNVLNALLCIAIAENIGVDLEIIQSTLENIHIEGRSEYIETYPGVNVFIDFAHNALSMEKILTTMSRYQPTRLITVFGCGGNRDRQRRYMMGKISGQYASMSIITSDNSRFEQTSSIMADIIKGVNESNGQYIAIIDRQKAIEYALEQAKKGDMILILGKGHEKFQEINGEKKEFIEKQIILDYVKRQGD